MTAIQVALWTFSRLYRRLALGLLVGGLLGLAYSVYFMVNPDSYYDSDICTIMEGWGLFPYDKGDGQGGLHCDPHWDFVFFFMVPYFAVVYGLLLFAVLEGAIWSLRGIRALRYRKQDSG